MKKPSIISITKITLIIMIISTVITCGARSTSNASSEEIPDSEKTDTTYLLGNYLINPSAKTVGIYTFFSFSDGDIDAWGYDYVPDNTIHYDSTTLYIVGNKFFFKEQIGNDRHSYPHCDFNSLKVIYADDNRLICRDKDYLYGQEYDVAYKTIDLSDYEVINDYVYKKDGEFYFLSHGFELKKIEGVTLHIPTLKHLKNNYFTDKNGLYLLGGYSYIEDNTSYGYEKSIRLEKSNGRNIIPTVSRRYIAYNGKVYSPAQSSAHKPLPLMVNKMKELEIYGSRQACFLADDSHTFESERNDNYSTAEFDVRWFNEHYPDDFFRKKVNQWQVISRGDIDFIEADNGKTLYFPSEIKQFGGTIQNHILVKAPDGFYIFKHGRGSTLRKIEKVFIFNFDAKEYEELDASQYRYISESLRVYKNRVYGVDGLPVKETIDTEKLRFIERHGLKTNYLTDGKSLIYTGRGGVAIQGKGIDAMQALGECVIQGVDFALLKVITPDILIDNEHIYDGKGDGICVIPIDKLGLDIKIYTEE